MRLYEFTVGADPELFIINTKTNKVISSVGLIPGLKGDPYTDDMPEGFGLETDNILAEFNIPPCRTITEWIHNIEYMKEYIRSFVKRINPDYDIKCSAYEEVDEDQLQSEQAQEFGCDPDYNVYTMKVNPKPVAKNKNGRSAGFHIHFGYHEPNIDTSIVLLKYFDVYLGLPSLLYDTDVRRRSLYGKAGAFRLTPYGFEFRTLSSAMLNSIETISLMFQQIVNAVDAFSHGKALPYYKDVVKTINNSDVEFAKKLIDKYKILESSEKITAQPRPVNYGIAVDFNAPGQWMANNQFEDALLNALNNAAGV